MKQLILTRMDPISSEYEAEHLGPWSLSDAQFFQWGWEKHGIRRVIKHEDILPVSQKLERVCEFYVAKLRHLQNERHRRSYSKRYWRILLMGWLLRVVICSFERFLRIRNQLKSNTPYLVYLAPQDESLSSVTTSHFDYLIFQDPLNRLIFSRFFRAYRPAGWVMRDGAPAPEEHANLFTRENYAKFKKPNRKLEIYHWAHILASNLGYVQFLRVQGLNPFDSFYMALRMRFRNARRCKDAVKSFQKKSEAKNGSISKDDIMEEIGSIQDIDAREAEIFLQVVDGLIEETMPKAFTDDFRANEKKALVKIKATSPWTDTIACGPVLGTDDQAKFYVSNLLERRPVRLVVNQHGGGYGLKEAHPWYHLVEYKAADRFISWGWEVQSDYQVTAVPAASPLLSKVKRSRKRNSSIVLIGSCLIVYSKLLATDHLPEDIPQHMVDEVHFIRHLNDALRSTLFYKPHPTAVGLRYVQRYVQEKCSGVQILTEKLVGLLSGRMSPALAQCRVCVLPYMGTTAAFTMAAGIPTIFFWNENVWRVSRDAKSDIEKLREVKVHHSSPESAARHLNAVWPDVDSWWEDSETQEAVSAFAYRYYRGGKNWRSEWVDMFCSTDAKLWKD